MTVQQVTGEVSRQVVQGIEEESNLYLAPKLRHSQMWHLALIRDDFISVWKAANLSSVWEEASVADTYYGRLVPDVLLAVFESPALRCRPHALAPHLRTLHALLLPHHRAGRSCQRKDPPFRPAPLNDFDSKASGLMLHSITTTFSLGHLDLLTAELPYFA